LRESFFLRPEPHPASAAGCVARSVTAQSTTRSGGGDEFRHRLLLKESLYMFLCIGLFGAACTACRLYWGTPATGRSFTASTLGFMSGFPSAVGWQGTVSSLWEKPCSSS